MKKQVIFYIVLACSLTSCLDKDKFTQNTDEGDEKEKLDLSFDFGMKSEKDLVIDVQSAEGSPLEGVTFYAYLENPYTEEGDHRKDILPLFSGKSGKNGKITTRITVSNMATELFIYTPHPDFEMLQAYDIQNNINAAFTAIDRNSATDKQLFAKAAASRAKGGEHVFTGERSGQVIDLNNNLYSFYSFPFANNTSGGLVKDGIPTDTGGLIEIDALTPEEKTIATNLFPEHTAVPDEKYFGGDYCTDLSIDDTQGAHVWVTFIGDGGFSKNGNNSTANALCYYTYTGTLSATDAHTVHKTMIYPNTNVQSLNQNAPKVIGSRVQLLYWDGTKYVDTFPKGVKIGWLMISNDKNTIGKYNDYSNIGRYRFSTPILNSSIGNYPGNYTGGICRWLEEKQMNVVGMENRQHLDPDSNNDKDYNDILFKVTSDPVAKPIDEIPPVKEEYALTTTGTLAFEDNWPEEGDYDFNDFVTAYTYKLVAGTDNTNIKGIRLTFSPKALGAAYNSGFAIQLPVNPGNIASVTGGTLEAGEKLATLIVYENIRRDGFGGRGGFLNTQKGNDLTTGTEREIYVSLKENITLSSFQAFNPFIYVNGREHEIHLTDKAPTGKMNYDLFNTKDDRSTPDSGHYYRKNNSHPWALDITSTSNGSSTNSLWAYPSEGNNISLAYPNYNQWTSDHNTNWLNGSNAEYLY